MRECLPACTSHTLGAHGDQERISESQNLVTDVCELPNRGQLSILQGKQGFLLLGHLFGLQIYYFYYLRKSKMGLERCLCSQDHSLLFQKNIYWQWGIQN